MAVKSSMEAFIWHLLGYAVYPAWLVTGLVDFITHQRSHIASTSGVRESLLHVAQMVQNSAPVLVALFLEINALTLARRVELTAERKALGPLGRPHRPVRRRAVQRGAYACRAVAELALRAASRCAGPLEMKPPRVAPSEIALARGTPPQRNPG